MANSINSSIPIAPPIASSTSSSDSAANNSASVDTLNGPSASSEVTPQKHPALTQDAYGVAPTGARGNVLSSQPPVPTDVAQPNATSLRSAVSKMAFLTEGTSVGGQALTLHAENSGVAAAGDSVKATATSSDSSGTYDAAGSSPSSATAAQEADTKNATDTATKWIAHINSKKCHHVDKEMASATGLPSATAKQALALMKASGQDYSQQIGTAMAVLAQEKKDGNPDYKQDAATITKNLQTMTDNVNTRGSGDAKSTQSCLAFDTALGALSGVVTKQLGGDPSGGAPSSDPFDPNTAKVVNSWA